MTRLLTHRLWVVVASVSVLALAALGCTDLSQQQGTDGSDTPGLLQEETLSTDASVSTTTSVPPTTTSVTSPATTTVSIASSEDLLPNGNIQACGFIKNVWIESGVRMLQIDYIDYFTGAEADAAAIADGFVIEPGDHVDGGWYMRNNNPLLRTYVVSNSVAITTSSRDYEEGAWDPPCSWDDFLSFWGPPEGLSFNETQIKGSKWWIERQGDTVVVITENWTP